MTISYTIPTIEDIEALCELNKYLFYLSQEQFDSTLNPDWLATTDYRNFFIKYIQNQNMYILVARDEQKMIGYIAGAVSVSPDYRKHMTIAEIENVMVLPEYQAKGIGKQLLDNFVQWARASDAQRLRVNVYARNLQAQTFYTHLGFASYDMNLEKDILN